MYSRLYFENRFYTVITETSPSGDEITKYECHEDYNNYYIVTPNIIAKKFLSSGETSCGTLYSNADKEKECYTV
jgi:hypothetical protein